MENDEYAIHDNRNKCNQYTTKLNTSTYSLLLGCSLFLRGSLLLRCSLLGLGCLFGLGLVGRAELVGGLGLNKVTIGYGLLQGGEEGGIHPLLIGREVGLHMLLDSNGGGAGTVLEFRNGGEDSCFV